MVTQLRTGILKYYNVIQKSKVGNAMPCCRTVLDTTCTTYTHTEDKEPKIKQEKKNIPGKVQTNEKLITDTPET